MTKKRMTKKNVHAVVVALGKRGAKVRMRKVTPARRQEIARTAAQARWARRPTA